MAGASWSHHNIGRIIIFDGDQDVWVGSSSTAAASTTIRRFKSGFIDPLTGLQTPVESFTLPNVLACNALVYRKKVYYAQRGTGTVIIKNQDGETVHSSASAYALSYLRLAFLKPYFLLLEYKNAPPEDDIIIKVISPAGTLIETKTLAQPVGLIGMHAFDSSDNLILISGSNDDGNYQINVYDTSLSLVWTYDTGVLLNPLGSANLTNRFTVVTDYDSGPDSIVSRLMIKATGELLQNIPPALLAADGYIPNGEINWAVAKDDLYIAWDGLNATGINRQGYAVHYKIVTDEFGVVSYVYQSVLDMPFQSHFCRGVWVDRDKN